ncbi:exodeoxyribonuclease V subunit alpha [Geobacter sp. FeAm09]|uniref:exodeoxyribonuclease V subunit alpha n=1 Tax=Geobacter sp. FeAm09 TaxID=2597769 RepID=UPI0011EED18B|nr:exodeoxyribonuclease V subunit alpha [Geobacter sp. FeAm09]QEM66839.1 exodeoxyribonuclease V subunit alpha [Geobacter sp. FeAm09]
MTESLQLTCLDRHFADFIQRIDPCPCEELWLAAALTSNATCRGHICLDPAGLRGTEIVSQPPADRQWRISDPSQWLKALEPCATVGRPGDYAPLVVDDGRLYLHRSWDNERQVADGLLVRSVVRTVDESLLAAALERYFPSANDGEPDQQREAARLALTRGVAVVSGGPGTGKTATVARILALVAELAPQPPRIVLATPTGKAAMRLKRSIMQAVEHLPIPGSLRQMLPTEVVTIHRLLGAVPGKASYRHNRENRLACDVLVVDEASMVDLPLMARLLEALPDNARMVLLGDRDQLASVEAGAVLADICSGSSAPGPMEPGRPAVVQLSRSYRFGRDSGIGNLSRLVNAGDGTTALELLTSGEYGDVAWRPLPSGPAFGPAFRERVQLGYSVYRRARTPAEALDELDRFRVLAPHREGAWGVENLNRLCREALGLHGRDDRLLPVMVTGNTYELGLFNGDTGVLMDDPVSGDLAAWFNDPEGALRRLSPLRLPPHESAFALTVHKSQGSEFDRVLLILPERVSETLSRELLYTAVTRARSHVEIWGGEEVFLRAVERRTVRSSGLRERLWGEKTPR